MVWKLRIGSAACAGFALAAALVLWPALLAACANPEAQQASRQAAQAEADAKDDAACREKGLTPGTEPYDACRNTLAQATAALTELTCASPAQPVHAATVDVDTGLAALSLALRIPSLGINLSAGPVEASSAALLDFEGPFVPQIDTPSDDNTKRVGTDPAVALTQALNDLAGSLADEPPTRIATPLGAVAVRGPA